jgi:hypothetical protein
LAHAAYDAALLTARRSAAHSVLTTSPPDRWSRSAGNLHLLMRQRMHHDGAFAFFQRTPDFQDVGVVVRSKGDQSSQE